MVRNDESNTSNGLDSGGQGGDLLPEAMADMHHMRATLKLVERAVKKGWDVPDEMRRALPLTLSELALEKSGDARTKIAAARVLVAMEHQNLTSEIAAARIEHGEDPGAGDGQGGDQGVNVTVNDIHLSINQQITADPQCSEALDMIAQRQAELMLDKELSGQNDDE